MVLPAASAAKAVQRTLQRFFDPERFKGVAEVLLSALVLAGFGTLFRLVFLPDLGGRLIWLTFYPMVMLGAVVSGWRTGMLVVSGAILVAFRGGPLFGVETFIRDHADWMGLGVFVLNGTMMSGIGELSIRSRSKALREMRRAEEAARSKSRFLASMSHEIRTPLNVILGYANLLRKDPGLGSRAVADLDVILRSGSHLTALINEILEHARLQAGKETARLSVFDLDGMIRELAELFERSGREREIEVVSEGLQVPGRWVEADQGKLRQILFNLLGNALKFTPEGRIRIGVTGSPEEGMRIRVEDSGPGVSDADVERIFEPFEGQTELGRKKGGAGLGLSIARDMARVLGGDLACEAGRSKGAGFVLSLPPMERKAELRLEETGSLVSFRGERFRVLVVDDHELNRKLVRRVLEEQGIDVSEAGSGEEALAMLESHPCRVVVTDVLMPGMGGIEMVRRIRERWSPGECMIIGLSASADHKDYQDFVVAGGKECLPKPLDARRLLDLLGSGRAQVPGAEQASDRIRLEASAEWLEAFGKCLRLGDLAEAGRLTSELPGQGGEQGAWIRSRVAECDLAALRAFAQEQGKELS